MQESVILLCTWNLCPPKAVSHVRMTSAARPINRVSYYSKLLKHSKIQSNLPFKMMHLTLILLLLDFVHCSYKIYSHSLIAVLRHTHIPHCSLTFPHCSYKAYSHSLTAVMRALTFHSLIAVTRHTNILSLLLRDTLIT